MSGETDKEVSGWTVDTLHSHMVSRLNALDKLLDERATAQEERVRSAIEEVKAAVTKADAATEKRFDAVNEFRQTLSDQSALFLTRTEYDANHKALQGRVSDLTDRVNRTEGRSAGMTATFGALLAVSTIVISVVVVFINVLIG